MSTLTSYQAEQIRRLLDHGLPYREIASRMGVSTGAVYRIANDLWAPESRPVAPPPNARRCPDCGAMAIDWPCRTCAVRRQLSLQKLAANSNGRRAA